MSNTRLCFTLIRSKKTWLIFSITILTIVANLNILYHVKTRHQIYRNNEKISLTLFNNKNVSKAKRNLATEKLESNDLNIIKEKSNDKLVDSPVIFIGGYARSGTTLMRAILDVHENVNCGPETKILPMILEFIKNSKLNTVFMNDIQNAHIKIEKIDEAVGLFIDHILRQENKTTRKCTKDPDILYHMEFLHKIFPKAKFIYMVRDGRGAAYSLMKRFNEPMISRKFQTYLSTWEGYNIRVNKQCRNVGSEFCKVVKYEELILNNKDTIKSVADFLNLTWTNEFLHHEKYIGNKVVVSNTEWSTDQIKQKIYTDSLNSWNGMIKGYETIKFNTYTMLSEFGYQI